MDDYAEYLAAEAKSEIAALHQFKILYNDALNAFHFFFEGEEDSLYYMPEARRLLSNHKAYIYDCGGKKNVISVRDALSGDGYDLKCCLFFVDRDYDDMLGTQVHVDESTYITDYYSIENHMSCDENVEILLTDVIRLSGADPQFPIIVEKFARARTIFHERMLSVTVWLLAAKEAHRLYGAQHVAPNLNNTNGLSKVARVGEGGSIEVDAGGFSYFRKQVMGDAAGPPFRLIVKWAHCLRSVDPMLWVRGKYEVWFFREAMLKIVEETNSHREAAGAKVLRIPSALRDGRLFELLGGRQKLPASLNDFLRSKLPYGDAS